MLCLHLANYYLSAISFASKLEPLFDSKLFVISYCSVRNGLNCSLLQWAWTAAGLGSSCIAGIQVFVSSKLLIRWEGELHFLKF